MNNYEMLVLVFIILIGVVCLAVITIAVFELRRAHKDEKEEREYQRELFEKQSRQRGEMMELEKELLNALKNLAVVQGNSNKQNPSINETDSQNEKK